MLFEQGVQAQKSGKPAEAEAIYRQIIAADAHNFDALHMLGIVCTEQGKFDEAERFFEQALTVDANFPPFFHNFGLHHSKRKQYEKAIAQFDRALQIYPNYPPVLSDRGSALAEIGRLNESLDSHNKAVALAPNVPMVFSNRALTFIKLRDHAAALADYDEALKRASSYADAWLGRGNVLSELKRSHEALAAYDQVLALAPASADAFIGRGGVYFRLGRYDEALLAFDRAIALKPNAADAWNGRGTVLSELKRYDEAAAAFDKAIALNPDFAEAWSGRGGALDRLGRGDQAFTSFDKALTLKPGLAEAWAGRGDALFALKRYEDALAAYRTASELKPDFPEAQFSEGFTRLLTGDLEGGWPKFEARWNTRQFMREKRNFAQPVWLGDGDIAGKTILIHSEQGLGDTIMMCRYAPMVAALGAKVILEVQPALMALVQGLDGVSQVAAKGRPLPGFDVHCPIMSLPFAFRTRMDTIPAATPYLKASDDAQARWSKRMHGAGLKVGLAWAGNPNFGKDPDRSILLKNILPVSSVEGVSFYGLQKDLRDGDRDILTANPQIVHLGGEIEDFRDTAAIMASLDLIISSDTSIVHAAGALGKPVWILLPSIPDWRWMLERNDSPWYPAARLFRQKHDGDWRSVTDEVSAELRKLAASRSQ